MSEVATIALLTCLAGCLAALVTRLAYRPGEGIDWTHPVPLFVGPCLLYIIALPFSRLVLHTAIQTPDIPYLTYQAAALASFALGAILPSLVLSALRGAPRSMSPTSVTAPRRIWPLDVTLAGSTAVHLATLHASGGILTSITMPYGFTAAPTMVEEGQLSAFLGITALSGLAVLAYAYWHVLGLARKSAYVLVVAFTVISQFMSGSRNAPLWIVLPFGVIWLLRGKRLPSMLLLAAAVGGFGAMQVVATIRQVGFGNIPKVLPVVLGEASAVFDPVRGELGTSYNVYRIWSEMGQGGLEHALAGRTMVVDPLVTIIPRVLWPTRPDNIAITFSRDYYGGLEAGLGFSGLVESLINFGPFGPLVVYSMLGIAAALLTWWRGSWRANAGMIAAYALLAPASMNFNRIDAATVVKLYLMRVIVLLMVDASMRLRPEAVVEAVRRAAPLGSRA